MTWTIEIGFSDPTSWDCSRMYTVALMYGTPSWAVGRTGV